MVDFNDIHQEHGLGAVKASVDAARFVDEDIGAAIERLSKLKPLEYEQKREREAKFLNVRVSVLDKEVGALRYKDNSTEEKPRLGVHEAEPWSEPVNGKRLFQELILVFKKYLVLQEFQAEALSLWCIFSHCIDAGNIAPKLLIYSPEKRCGKTTLLDVLMCLVWKPLPASNITPAAIFRTIDAIGGTLLIDEADTFINDSQDISGIINSGHRKSAAYVIRLVGDNHEPKHFSTWAPTIIAMIGKPKDTITDRSIMIEMKRKRRDDSIERFIFHKAEPELKILCRKIARWAQDNFDYLRDADPATPENLNDRACDNWRPLIAIANQIGGICPKVSYDAAKFLSEIEQDEDDDSAGVMLLKDISDIFDAEKSRSRISTEDLLFKLNNMEERPWVEWNRGNPITARQVAKHLKPFSIKPQKFRCGYQTSRGYELAQFRDAFERYLYGTTEQVNNNNDL